MKGKEIIDSVIRNEMPDMETVRENCILQTMPEAPRKKRPAFRAAVSVTAVAVIALALFLGISFLKPHSKNAFSLTAYALEEQADGTFVYHEFSIQPGEQQVWGGYQRGVYWQGIRVLLKCDGENIQEIKFSTDGNATFSLADFKIENGEIVYDRVFYDDDGTFLGGQVIAPVEPLGKNFTISADELTDEFTYGLLLVEDVKDPGKELPPFRATIHATATFHDGSTQEVTLVYS